MARIIRTTINWTGFVGGPGYTNVYFAPAAGPDITQGVVDDALAKMDVWLNAYTIGLPQAVTVQVDPTVEEINDATGALEAFWAGTTEAAQTGSSVGAYSAATGACINWYTGGIRNARRVRGRSFMVPLGPNGFQSDGTIDNTRLAGWRTANNVLLANVDDAKLCVWSRPSGPAATDGISYDVISSTMNDKAAVLTSRRD